MTKGRLAAPRLLGSSIPSILADRVRRRLTGDQIAVDRVAATARIGVHGRRGIEIFGGRGAANATTPTTAKRSSASPARCTRDPASVRSLNAGRPHVPG